MVGHPGAKWGEKGSEVGADSYPLPATQNAIRFKLIDTRR